MGEQKVDILDPETLKDQTNLTPEQEEEIALSAQRDEEGSGESEEEAKAKEEAEAKEKEALEAKEKEDQAKEEEDAKKAEEEAKAKEEADAKAKDDEGKKKEEEELAQKKEEAIDSMSKALSTEKSIPVEEARKTVEGEYAVAEKYGHDPIKMARAYRNLQGVYSKSQEVIKAIQDQQASDEDGYVYYDDGSIKSPSGNKFTKDQVISQYRKQYPETTEDVEDGKVYEMARVAIDAKSDNELKVAREKRSADSLVKKVGLMEGLTEDAKPWSKEIKDLLDKSYSDEEVLNPIFDMVPIVNFVKGSHYDEDTEKLKKEYYEKGKADAKILETKTPPVGEGGTKTKEKKTGRKLTPNEEQRAEDMFGENMSKEEAIKAYTEMYPDAKNPEPGIN